MDWLTKTYAPDDWLTPDEVDDVCVCCQFRKAMYYPSQLCDKCIILNEEGHNEFQSTSKVQR